jgi:DNA-binding CsgD family transcriptional regulator
MRSNGNARDWHDRFQSAALEPSLWLTVLQELADATGSSRAELVGFGDELASFNWVTSCDDRMMADFYSLGAGSPEVNFRIAADIGSAPLQIVHEGAHDVARRTIACKDFSDFCEDYRMPFGCQTALFRGDGALVGLSILRSRAEGRTGEAEHAIFAVAARAARTAVHMQRAIERQGFHLLAGTFEAMSLPCLLTDGLGQVHKVTPAAERLLREHSGLQLERGRLSSTDSGTRRRIDMALQSVLLHGGETHARVPLNTSGPLPSLVIDLFRLPENAWAMHFAPKVIVVMRDSRVARSGDARPLLAAAFGLTGAESEVALALASGQSREAIAAARGVSVETLRTQVKSLYQKTGCRRETELALLVRGMFE